MLIRELKLLFMQLVPTLAASATRRRVISSMNRKARGAWVQSFIRGRVKPSPALRERVAEGRVMAHVNLRALVKRRPLTPPLSPAQPGAREMLR